MLNWLLFTSLVASLMLALVGLAMDLADQWWVEPRLRQHHSQIDQQMGPLRAWLDQADEHPLLKAAADTSLPPATPPPKLKRTETALAIDLDKKRTLISLGDRWLEKPFVFKDLANMADILATLHHEPAALEGLPPMDLVAATQLFLGEAYWSTDPAILPQRLAQSRHLCRHLLQSRSMETVRAGLSIAHKLDQVEREPPPSARSTALTASPHWTQIWAKELTHLEGLLSHLTPPSVLQEIFLSSRPPFGFCPSLANRRQRLAWERAHLGPRWPGERDFSQSKKAIEEIESRGVQVCALGAKAEKIPFSWHQRLPYFRRLYALNLLLKKYR